ncbi:MAG: hypothetical protein ACYC1I_10960 [Acidimicrobiales bacterium]
MRAETIIRLSHHFSAVTALNKKDVTPESFNHLRCGNVDADAPD